MAKNKMKKSAHRAPSERALQQAQQQEEKLRQDQLEKEHKEKIKKATMNNTIKIMLGIYSLLFSIMSWLIDYMGIISLIGTIIGLVGIIKLKEDKNKYFYFACIGFSLGLVRFLMQVYFIAINLLK